MDKNKFSIEVKKEGWGKMKTILDKEMPVKKRRYLPFLLLFLVLGIIGIGFLYSNIRKNNSNEIIRKEKTQYSDQKIINSTENEIITEDSISKIPEIINNKKTNTPQQQNRIKIIKTNTRKINKIDRKQYKLIAKSDKNNFVKKEIKTDSPEIAAIEDKRIKLNKIANIDTRLLSSSQKRFIPGYDFNYLVINRNNQTKLWDPFAGIRIHAYNYREFSPKFEFDLGSYFNVNDKFSFGAGIAFLQRKLVYQTVQKENYVMFGNNVEKADSRYDYDIEQNDQSKWIFELMLMEKYNFSGKTSIEINGGIVLGGIEFSTKTYDVSSPNYENKTYNPSNIKPVLFFGIELDYSLSNRLNAGLGYKYYYSGTYTFNDNNMEVYSQKLVGKEYSSRFYLGAYYYFR